MAKNEHLAQIITGCRCGDSESFSQLVDMYSGRLYGYFYRLTGNREVSDDLLSELFVKLVEKIKSYHGGSFANWLFRIASNLFYDYLRVKQREKKLLEYQQQQQLELEKPPRRQDDSERFDKLQVQLDNLDVDTKELIMLRFYSQLSFKEIAEIRAEPIGTTLSKMHRGLNKLRKLME